MNEIAHTIGSIFGNIGYWLILLLPLVLIFFIVRNAILLRKEMREVKEAKAAQEKETEERRLQKLAELQGGEAKDMDADESEENE